MMTANLGSLTAWLGLGIWTLSFVLMLRLPWLERQFGGMDRLYLAHHFSGGAAYMLLLAHALLVAAPAAFGDQWDVAAHLLNPLTASGPFIWGWSALLLLMGMMMITFWLPLRYRRWRQVHWIVAPAFAMGVVHTWPLVGDSFVKTGLVGMSVVVAICIVIQVILRWSHWRSTPYAVTATHVLRPDLAAIDLAPTGLPLPWQAGQFVFARFDEGPEWLGCKEWHPYTIAGPSADAAAGSMRLLIRAQGPCSRHVQVVPAGTRVSLRGPHGGFMQSPLPGRPQVWIAGGIGITPFLARLLVPTLGGGESPDANPVDLVFVRRPEDASLDELLGKQSPVPTGTRLHDLSSNERDAARLWHDISQRIGAWPSREVYLCGPPGLVDALTLMARTAGVPAGQIHSERFDFR